MILGWNYQQYLNLVSFSNFSDTQRHHTSQGKEDTKRVLKFRPQTSRYGMTVIYFYYLHFKYFHALNYKLGF